MKTIQTGKRITPDDLDLMEADLDSYQEPLIVAVFGRPGSGKSRLIATAPSPIGLIPTESKSRQTVLKDGKAFGKRILMPSIGGKETDLIRTANPMLLASLPETCFVFEKGDSVKDYQGEMDRVEAKITLTSKYPTCCQRHYYRWHVNRVKHVAYMMRDDDRIKTVAIDTFGTLMDDISYANYGTIGTISDKEHGYAPRQAMVKEVRDFLNNMATKHLILTHHAKEEWKDEKPTKKMIIDGKFSKLGHYTSVLLETIRDDKADLEEDGDKYEGKYRVVVRDCQNNAELIGQTVLTDGNITFANLAMAVYPDSEPEDWE